LEEDAQFMKRAGTPPPHCEKPELKKLGLGVTEVRQPDGTVVFRR
jgi:hypothetical protein